MVIATTILELECGGQLEEAEGRPNPCCCQGLTRKSGWGDQGEAQYFENV